MNNNYARVSERAVNPIGISLVTCLARTYDHAITGGKLLKRCFMQSKLTYNHLNMNDSLKRFDAVMTDFQEGLYESSTMVLRFDM